MIAVDWRTGHATCPLAAISVLYALGGALSDSAELCVPPSLHRTEEETMLRERNRRGPTGQMELSYRHLQSGNERREEYHTITLEASGDNLVLVETTKTSNSNSIPLSTDISKKSFEIPAGSLIDFVKNEGKAV